MSCLALSAVPPVPDLRRFSALRVVMLVGLGIAMAGSGCPKREAADLSTLPVITTDDPEAEADIRAAREAAEEGQNDEARRLFELFLREHPDDPLVPIAKLGLGRVLLARGDVEQARKLFEAVEKHADPSVAERGTFYVGVALHLEGQHAAALEVLRAFVGRTVDPEDTALLLRTIAASALHEGNRVGAVEAYDRLAGEGVPDADREEARKAIARILEGDHEPEEIDRLYERLPRSGLAWPQVARLALRRAYQMAHMDRVREIIEALRKANVPLDDELQAMAVRAERTGQADPRTVGAILSLSGRGREAGQQALKGLMLAGRTPPSGPLDPDAPQIVFRDDGGDPDRAVEAVNDLVSLHRVIAIIGPLDAQAAHKAAERAEELGVPLIALSPAEGVTNVGPMIFRQFVTPQNETTELVAAAQTEGARRFAVMHPENAYGGTMLRAFKRAVEEAGGELVIAESYDPAATAFRPQVEKLSRASFDALFVADAARTLSLIAPALAAEKLVTQRRGAPPPTEGRAITLLAPSVAYSPSALRDAGRYLQGTLFAIPFDATSATGAGRVFADAFKRRYGSQAGTYAAYAYDAFRLVQHGVRAGIGSRQGLAEHLGTLRDAETAGPGRGFGTGREPARGPEVYELRGATLVPVSD